MVRFACMELMWGGVEGPKFEPWLHEVRGLGFEGVAVRAATLRSCGQDGAGLKALLERHALGLAGVYLPLHDADQHLETTCRWMQMLGCPDLILHGGARGSEAGRAAAIQRIAELGARAEALGIHASYHHHSGAPFETIEEAEALLRQTHPWHVADFCDTGHATQDFAGHPAETRALLYLERNWPRMRYIEFKAWTPERGLSSELGEGPARLADVAAFLQAQRYQGWITLEQNAPTLGSLPRECAARSLEVAKTLFQKHAAATALR